MAFISCRSRLTKVLENTTRGEKGSKDGGSRARLLEVDTGRNSGLKYKWICNFKLAADIHKFPDAALDHFHHQFETVYELVLQSQQFPDINVQ